MRKNSVEKSCGHCGRTFRVQSYRADQAKFCSMACLWAGRSPRIVQRIAADCLQCGKTYFVRPYRQNSTKFCSFRCAALAPNPKREEARLAAIKAMPRIRLDPAVKAAKKKELDRAYYAAHKEELTTLNRARYRANPGQWNALSKKWREQNPEKARDSGRKQRALNGDQMRANRRQHYRDNKPIYVANARKREDRIRRAIPSWVDLSKIEQFYIQADRLTRVTGIKHHVDHIYPLKSDVMCGLHVETNLQVIPALINLRKSNIVADHVSPLCCAWPSAIDAGLSVAI